MDPIAPCSLQELMKRIVNNLYSYDYKSSKLPDILAHITRTDVVLILRMLRDLEQRGYIEISWHQEDHTLVYLEIKKRDHSRLPDSPYGPARAAEEQAA